jgi:putative flippase GtrA
MTGARETLSTADAMARRLRYFAAVLVALVVDLSVAMALRALLGAPLVAAAAGGFVVATAVNYAAFEFWAFRRADARFSVKRLAGTYMSALGAMAVRLVAVLLLEFLPGEGALLDLGRLGAAATVSFVVNYLIVSRVFTAKQTFERPQDRV